MSVSLIILLSVAAILLIRLGPSRREVLGGVLRDTRSQLVVILLRLPLALLAANFLLGIIPADRIATYLGNESGIRGLMLAAFFGALVPGGPFLTFPLALVVWRGGAGAAQMVAFLSAWSIFAVHRLLSFELPLLGGRFVLLRLTSSWALPLFAGMFAGLIALMFDVSFGR